MDKTTDKPQSAFHWQGPSQTINKYGRIKTERQMLLDAYRENAESNLGYATQKTNSEKAPR
jgi:hypothetical protein